MDRGEYRQAAGATEKALNSDHEPVGVADHHCGGVWRALLRLRLSHCLHRDTQQVARRNDQAQGRSIQLAVGQMGMGRATERYDIECPPASRLPGPSRNWRPAGWIHQVGSKRSGNLCSGNLVTMQEEDADDTGTPDGSQYFSRARARLCIGPDLPNPPV